MNAQESGKTQFAVGASVLAIALWILPITKPFAAPLVFLNTIVHELCHALTGMLTGGHVSNLVVSPDQSGLTQVSGGIFPLVATAGYVGSSIVGGVLIACSRTAKASRTMLMSMGIVVLAAPVLFVRGNIGEAFYTILWCAVWGGALLAAASKLKDDRITYAAAFLGTLQCLASVKALSDLYILTRDNLAVTDAVILEHACGIPAIISAIVWGLLSAACMVMGYKSALHQSGSKSG